MLNYIYRIERKKKISKSSIYSGFFSAPFVKMYCDQSGIDIATEEGAKHRCPFLVNVLEAMAAGVPFVTTNIGGINDIVTKFQKQCLINFGDTVKFVECPPISRTKRWKEVTK